MDDEATLEELCEEDLLETSPMSEEEEDESIQVSMPRAKKKTGSALLIFRVTVGIFLLTSFLYIIYYQDIEKGSGITNPGFFWTLVSLDIVMFFVLVILIYRSCRRPLVDPDPELIRPLTLEENILIL